MLLVGCISAAYTYLQTRQETNGMLDHQMEQVAAFLAARSTGVPPRLPALRRTDDTDTDYDIDEDYIVEVRDAGGQVLYASAPNVQLPPISWSGFGQVRVGGIEYRVYSAVSAAHRIAVAQQLDLRRETAAAAAFDALLPVGLMIPILAAIIAAVIRRQLLPLNETARAVAARAPVALDPLPTGGLPVEVRPLIEEINRLLSRVALASEHERRFIADAAHALRTPLAALQLQADVLDGSQEAAERAARVAELRAGIRRAVRLSHHLLALARSESPHGPGPAGTAVDPAVAEAFHVYGPIARARGVELRHPVPCLLEVAADPQDLVLLIGNLLDNALRYTAAGGRVVVATTAESGGVRIEVIDEGSGMRAAELEAVFQRFYRSPGDLSEGSGLGLAVVRAIVERRGGRVQLVNRTDRTGLIARVWLPGPVGQPAGQGTSGVAAPGGGHDPPPA
ncbi:MAG: two-component sensor histidine kinase [Gammaproteobacteria bacterium]|nr:two-component sensor histidine kinase [Gammaproteobacteria bacterium]